MEHSSPRSETQKLGIFSAGWHIFEGVLAWLASFVRLTEDEQEEAGIYLGDEGYE